MLEHDVVLLKGKLRKATPASAGYDLFATAYTVVNPGKREAIPTGVVTAMRPNIVGIISDRSGLAYNHGITTLAGIIDSDYVKEWHVILYNTGHYPLVVNAGDRIAQVVFVEHVSVIAKEEGIVEYNLGPRDGGFGSTGVV